MDERVKRVAYGGLSATGLYHLARKRYGGAGSLLMLHRVRHSSGGLPGSTADAITIRPPFLRDLIVYLRGRGYEFIALAQVLERLRQPTPGSRWISLTVDDGFADTYDTVYPVCKELDVPFALYATTGFADGTMPYWGLGLEVMLQVVDDVQMRWREADHHWWARDAHEKARARDSIAGLLRRSVPDELQEVIADLASRYGVDFRELWRAHALESHRLAEMAACDLITIGSHTLNHPSLPAMPDDVARRELTESKTQLEDIVGGPVRHLSYPYGHAGARERQMAAEAGYRTGCTTQNGNVFPEHADHLYQLPRVTVDGRYQRVRYVDAAVAGAVAALKSPCDPIVL